ncbi:MAG: hypothetical protein QG642_695 [Patescibacteria group bacterium]|nr:hypothetical protein [Patescibacteria group bacterium]
MGKYKYLYLGAFLVVVLLFLIVKFDQTANSPDNREGQEISGATSPKVDLYLFWGDGCPHCAKEEIFLAQMESKYPDLRIQKFEVWKHPSNARLMTEVAKSLKASVGGVPLTIVGDKHFIGFDESYTAPQIEDRIRECISGICPNTVASIVPAVPVLEPAPVEPEPAKEEVKTKASGTIDGGIFGEIDMAKFSLPVLTIVIGALDGFNPCAMWVLVFLISLLIGMENRKRMWILGLAFIVASAAVYFLFMVAWLNVFLFMGVVSWVKVLIGLVALAGAWYSLRDFYKNKDAACEVGDMEKKKKTMDKLKGYVASQNFWLALFGIMALAFMVNLVELLCSAGFPAVYTQVLAMNDMVGWQYYSYILLYILFFMLDDLVVFFIAMFTLQATGLTTKYTRFSRLIGGILMLIIGLLMIFKPELLMSFGV